MENRHCYYNKDISRSRPLFQKTDIARESVYLRTIDRKLTLNLIVIFNSSTDISFRKFVTEIFCDSYYFQEKTSTVLRCDQLSVAVFVFILSSKGANQLQGKFSTKTVVLKCISSNYFLEICRRFRTTSEKLAMENYVLAYHTANKDHNDI